MTLIGWTFSISRSFHHELAPFFKYFNHVNAIGTIIYTRELNLAKNWGMIFDRPELPSSLISKKDD